MQTPSIKRSLFLLSFLFTGVLVAQDKPLGNETVIVVKPYTPSVNDAFKIKETPVLGDSVSLEKKPIKYSIFSVPVASTFTPSKGRATKVEKDKRIKLYDNYITLGFGTYSNVLAEFYSNLEISKSDNFGVYLTHNSSQGGIEDVRLDDKFYDTELNLNYSSRNKKSSWNTELGLQHQLFNWYGLPEQTRLTNELVTAIDPQQNYISGILGGKLELYDSFLNKASANYRYFGDSYDSAEHNFKADGAFEVNIADELISTKVFADVLSGKFDKGYNDPNELNYSQMIFGITPSLLILRDDLTLNLGASFVYGLDTENSDSSFYIYPQVTASYRLAGDYFIPYAGLEGSLSQNTYYNFAQENPYVSPTLNIAPTDKTYDAYVGAKGKLTNSIGYNLKGGYASEINKALFLANFSNPSSTEDYAYGNSFGVVYDDINTLSFSGEINVDVNRDFKLGLNGSFFSYNSEFEAEAWNLPEMKASLFMDYQITEKWFAGANLFYTGERKDREETIDGGGALGSRTITLDGFTDLNANLGYRFNDQLSIFAKGNNLLGDNYERWSNFPVQGIQVMAGATYKFDYK
ncbi:TonB-dependent receptor domain-containing protein [Gillisia hiemivivida]|uniref:TonB-dependent receptor n=1 Tax=Gillisia hiemivivida TaxID=291190 RepID=A0A5C6ZP77_9FLAO|nr:TonB-dependent receptor [Gillisia hiemivivida]TXD92162.1 TonB-dependent receptor [Gillisia hiemivivida]